METAKSSRIKVFFHWFNFHRNKPTANLEKLNFCFLRWLIFLNSNFLIPKIISIKQNSPTIFLCLFLITVVHSGIHAPLGASWCAFEKNLAPSRTERSVDPCVHYFLHNSNILFFKRCSYWWMTMHCFFERKLKLFWIS